MISLSSEKKIAAFIISQEWTVLEILINFFEIIPLNVGDNLLNVLSRHGYQTSNNLTEISIHQTFKLLSSSDSISLHISPKEKSYFILLQKDCDEDAELHKQLERTQRLTKTGTWELDLKTKKLNWSMEQYRIFEIPEDCNTLYEEFIKRVPEEEKKKMELKVANIISSRGELDYETYITMLDGRVKIIRSKMEVIVDNNDNVIKIAGTDQDITQEKLLEQKSVTDIRKKNTEIEEAQERLQFALLANKFGIWDWNMTDDVLYWDENMFTLFEVDREDFTNNFSGIESLFFPDDKNRVLEEVEKAFKGNSALDTWFRIVTPKGNAKFIGAKGKVNNRKKDKLWMTGVNWDITKEKTQEQIIIEQQSKMITSARLSSLGEMAGGIAHEINNPLQIILGHSNRLKRKLEKDMIQKDDFNSSLSEIEKTCERIVTIIRGLKNFSRNGEDASKSLTTVGLILSDVISLISEKFNNNGIKLSLDISFDEKVLVNTVQLGQVFMNLMNNAFDAVIGLETKWIHVRAYRQDDFIVISFIDSGQGIPKEVSDKMFEPFFTTKDIGVGTGLGLSVSKGILLKDGGKLTFEIVHGHTSFSVWIPLYTD
jgi:signal transduction histidine kinase